MLRRLIRRAIRASPAARLALSPATYVALIGGSEASARLFAELPVRVPIEMCVGFTGFPYGASGWHYLVALLEEMDRKPDLPLEQSILTRFHERFQPASSYHLVAALKPDVRFRPPLGIMPWGDVTQPEHATGPSTKDWRTSRWYGPSPPAVVRDEYDRVRAAYDNIRRFGYDPWGRGFIGGQFLRAASGELRYVILQGNHRAAILAHLGYDTFLARAIRGRRALIDARDVRNWPFVKSGASSADDALAYFHAYFQADGEGQARACGLIA